MENETMTFLEFIGPTKALVYGLAFGFVIGCVFTVFIETISRR
jgi:hypothetical protein